MIDRYNRVSVLFGVPGFLLQVGGNFATVSTAQAGTTTTTLSPLGRLAILAGTALLLVGLAFYAKAKGRHPAWCLMAFLSIIGLIVLACLEDKTPGRR